MYPSYSPTPWELDTLLEGAKKKCEKYKNMKHPNDKRTPEQKLLDTWGSDVAEFANKQMWLDECLKKIAKSQIDDPENPGLNYDQHVQFHNSAGELKDCTIDVKCATKHGAVQSPETCNFMWSQDRMEIKAKAGRGACDFYSQWFFDQEKGIVYFIGAMSYNRILDFVNKTDPTAKWKIPPGVKGNWGLIKQQDMDLTLQFKKYFKKIYLDDFSKPLN